MYVNCKVSGEVLSCMFDDERRGRESQRGEMSKVKYRQKSSKLYCPHPDKRKARVSCEERKSRWLAEFLGEDHNLTIEEIIQSVRDAGFPEFSMRFPVQRRWPSINYPKGGRFLELLRDNNFNYEAALRALVLEVLA